MELKGWRVGGLFKLCSFCSSLQMLDMGTASYMGILGMDS